MPRPALKRVLPNQPLDRHCWAHGSAAAADCAACEQRRDRSTKSKLDGAAHKAAGVAVRACQQETATVQRAESGGGIRGETFAPQQREHAAIHGAPVPDLRHRQERLVCSAANLPRASKPVQRWLVPRYHFRGHAELDRRSDNAAGLASRARACCRLPVWRVCIALPRLRAKP